MISRILTPISTLSPRTAYFYGNGPFIKGPQPAAKDLENAFHGEVFALLKKEGLITDFVIDNMMNWHHSGFNVYCGKTLWPDNEEGLENLD